MLIKHIPINRGEIVIRRFSDGTYNVRPVWDLVNGGVMTHYFYGLTKGQAMRMVDYYAGRHITW